MTNRGLLRRQMRKAWIDTVRSAYMDQVISSERALQVHFTARLMDLFWEDGVKRRVFVEPVMHLDTGERVHPDLLICNAKAIIGVVELKYQPKKSPNHAKDFATFESLAARDTDMQIQNRRYRGPEGGGGRYALDRDPMYVWAGVYRGPVREIPEVPLQNVDGGKLLVLHAATRAHEEPEIFSKSGHRTSRIS